MANGRNKGGKRAANRDSGGFLALPWSVLDSPSYGRLSHAARSLLLEIARQYVGDNNGRLLASAAYLSKRGWKSADVITRAKRDLLSGGFIHETVRGHRPNKASWYAVTWQALDRIPGYDAGALELFERSAYARLGLQSAVLRPSAGAKRVAIAPFGGLGGSLSAPPDGAVRTVFRHPPAPSGGDHLEMPSPVSVGSHCGRQEQPRA